MPAMEITAFVQTNREKAFALGDYAAYHDQCGRHAASLRRKLNIATPKNQKFQKKGPLTGDMVAKDAGYVQLQLLAAEKAWAHAMSVKTEQSQDDSAGGPSGKARKYILMRLRRAAMYAGELATVLKEKASVGASDVDYLEAQAYRLSLCGSLEFEKQFHRRFENSKSQRAAWRPCLCDFSEAHVIYTALLGATQKDIYKEALSATIDPSIRYAAYQSRFPRTLAVASVAKQHFRQDRPYLSDVQKLDPDALSERKASITTVTKDGTTTADIPTDITWRGRVAPIVDASVGAAIAATSLAADHLNSSLPSFSSSRDLAGAYDPVLTAAQDAVDAVRIALTELSKEGIPESDARVQDLRVTDLAINYALVSWRIGRNRVLASTSASKLDDGLAFTPPLLAPKVPQSRKGAKKINQDAEAKKHLEISRGQKFALLRDRAVLYASTLQSLNAIAALPGASRDTSFMTEIESQKAYFRALRCLNVGYSHQLLGRGHESKALALFARAAEAAAATATTEALAPGAPTLAISPTQVQSLQTHSKLAAARQQGSVLLRDISQRGTEDAVNRLPFISTMDSYPLGSVSLDRIVMIPPQLEPVPVKPIFLDVAYNYITYPGQHKYEPSISERGVEEPSGSQTPEADKRKSGWFGGLLGR